MILVIAGCGSSATTITETSTVRAPAPPVGGKIYSQGARLHAGATVRLLRTPVLDLQLSCADERADVSVTIKGATSDAVVTGSDGRLIQPELQPGHPLVVPLGIPGIQTWSISGFSEGASQPTTLTVAVRDLDGPAGYFSCASMAQAVVGDATGTLTK